MRRDEQKAELYLTIDNLKEKMRLAWNRRSVELMNGYYFKALFILDFALDVEIIGLVEAERIEKQIKEYKERLING